MLLIPHSPALCHITWHYSTKLW